MKPGSSLRSPGAALLTGLGLCAVLALAASGPGFTDDRDLLRFSSSKPYLFILLDTSASMNLQIGAGDRPVLGGGDNPNSRIYAAKQALFNVFSNVDDVFFGFTSFNQDGVYVKATHHLYYNETPLPGTWPLPWPAADGNGLTSFVDRLNLTGADVVPPLGTPDNVDGIPDTVIADLQGDALTFGPMFDFSGNGNVEPAEQEAGTCAAPLLLGALGDTNRLKLNTFSLVNTQANPKQATLWIRNAGTTYQVLVSSASPTLGLDNLPVTFELRAVTAAPCTLEVAPRTLTLNMRRDPRFNQYLVVDGPPAGGNTQEQEIVPNLWPGWSDAITSAACDNPRPHSGKGWEGNYDADDTPPAGITLAPGYPSNLDRHCVGSDCVEIKPVQHTVYSTVGLPSNPGVGRPLDTGDMLPFDWNNSQRTAMLRRLAPNYGVDTPVDFGIAGALKPSATVNGLYEARLPGRAPLIAGGNTPLGKAILDFRCWYTGNESNKCGYAATASAGGWAQVACTLDSEYGCRRPYLIVISDGDDNCRGENPASDTAGLHSKAGIKTWAINLGDPGKCGNNSVLHPITQNGKGECVNVSDPEELLTTIQDILGRIREEARTFASAAVPSVQAIAKQTLYLTDFTPLNDHSRWPGHVNAFLKPLPTDNGKPDPTVVCGGLRTTGCFLWDAAEVLANDQVTRKVIYPVQSKKGLWAVNWQDFAVQNAPAPTEPDDSLRYDLWKGFDLIAEDVPQNSLTPAQETALHDETSAIITETLSMQTRSPCDPSRDLCQYKLGDIFHSDPLVFGASFNADFLRIDAGSQFNSSGAACSANGEMTGGTDNPAFDRGYRCFAERQGFRRQVVYIGSNDGMLHAFNAAQFDTGPDFYDNGTGHELFAFMPRTVMPTVKTIAQGLEHHFTVDGPIHAADVFIDPIDDGDGLAYPRASERRWRTVLVAGLREGGSGYYALDVTQPDPVVEIDGRFEPDYSSEPPEHAPKCLVDYDAVECGPVQYGAPLWEFTDNTDNQLFADPTLQPAIPYKMDEDGNGLPDLAFSWSQADFARVQICEGTRCTITPNPADGADVKEKYVVFFGGGLDIEHKDFDPRNAADSAARPSTYQIQGNWLYMVDVETGETLYKRQLCSPYAENVDNPANPCIPAGSVPSAVAAVDTDLNGFVDRVYVGTTGGFMFRVDLQVVTTALSGTKKIEVPALESMTVNALDLNSNPTAVTIKRVPETASSGDPIWRPYVIFDANWTAGAGVVATAVPRPIYFAPAVVIYQDAGAYALAFGTGDRDDLWNANKQPGRFYVFMDDHENSTALSPTRPCPTLTPGAICPRTEADYQSVALNPLAVTRTDFLLTRTVGRRGWYLTLPDNERVITDTFSFSGLTFFSSYQPLVALTDEDGNPLSNTGGCGDNRYESNTTASCAKTGVSSLFLVSTVNGNGLLPGGERTKQVASFVTNPFTQLTTGNTDSRPQPGATPAPTPAPIPPAISDLFPKSCRFANARIDISTIAADTTLQELGSVPICMTQHSWKEF